MSIQPYQPAVVLSVNGQTGFVVLNSDDVSADSEGSADAALQAAEIYTQQALTEAGESLMPLPSGTPVSGQVPVATGHGSSSQWQTVGGLSAVSSVNGHTGVVVLAASDVDADASGSAGTAQANAESFATSAVSTETSRAEAAEALALQKSSNLSDVGTRQTALNNLAGAVTTAQFLRGNGTNVAMSAIQSGDIPVLNQNTTGTASNITDTLDQVPAPAANLSLNSHKITSLANGSSAQDAVAFSQLPSSGSPLSLANGGTGTSAGSDAALLTAIGAFPAAGGTLTGGFSPAVATLTFVGSGTTLINAASGNSFNLTLTASTTTLGAPSNPVDGQVIRIRITQGSGGSFTLSYNSVYDFGTAGAPTLSVTATKVDILGFEYVASISKWCYLGSGLGF
jgi:hypothetical protein